MVRYSHAHCPSTRGHTVSDAGERRGDHRERPWPERLGQALQFRGWIQADLFHVAGICKKHRKRRRRRPALGLENSLNCVIIEDVGAEPVVRVSGKGYYPPASQGRDGYFDRRHVVALACKAAAAQADARRQYAPIDGARSSVQVQFDGV